MSVESEMLVERRRARRKLTGWRIGALMLGLLLLLVVVLQAETDATRFSRDQIARVQITGMILDSDKQQKLLEELKDEDRVKAVVLQIDSPGGTTVGGEALYLRIRDLAKKKPVVATFGTVAASAAYLTALAANRIVTRGNTITGSVGVIVQWPDVSDLMAKLGVTMEELKSGRLKATPSPFKRDDPANLAPMKELVEDSFNWFIGLVKERRNITIGEVPGLVEGRVYSGRQAVEYGLADEIGGEDEAVAWLVKEKGIAKKLPVIEHEPKSELSFGVFSSALIEIGQKLGIDSLVALAGFSRGVSPAATNGLLSIWSPALMK